MKHSFLCVTLLGIAPASLPAAERPNIVIILVDDMGVMDTSVPFLTDAAGKPSGIRSTTITARPTWSGWPPGASASTSSAR